MQRFKKRKSCITLLLVITCATFLSCQKSAPQSTAAAVTAESRWTVDAATPPSELEGSWTGCRNASGIGSRETLSFHLNEMEYSYTMYASLDCQGPLLEIIAHGSFEISGPAEIPEGATKITFDLKKFYATALSESIAGSLNKQSACGISNWAAKQTFTIDLSPCSVNSVIRNFAKTNFSIYKITEDSKLSLGEPNTEKDATSDEKRPDHYYSHDLLKIVSPTE